MASTIMKSGLNLQTLSLQPRFNHRGLRFKPQALFGGLFGSKPSRPVKPPPRPTVVPEPSFNIPISLVAISALEGYEGWTGLAAFTAVLGIFLSIQATRIRFLFDDEGLSVIRAGEETENVFVGGSNKWSYESFINWEYWFPGFPVLVYFKESQTKPEGQIHFFPIIFNGKQLYDVMAERCGPSQGSGPKDE
ncbi:hypothetical protein CEUSTIGMA_g10950.t1 [Chlamydomonas eustigma]|uniref:DUF3119 family protein n=1 Tax=Chlamydomonas eustigma TaxID=1157962 RepID=A0A250XKB3_9CHLO|nr:hypothetical protein CEUSTIGMA_g10950.t1 [Chlamydomonas eustigma]|eukprot:GAX83525.1 hypothetical protein CEUSTIGMA_g10950.t1 [Chlamydomonas eustigma]